MVSKSIRGYSGQRKSRRHAKQRFRRILLAVLLSLLLLMVVQLVWPGDRSRPFTRVRGEAIGLMRREAMQTYLQQLDARELSVGVNNQTYDTTYAELGIAVDEQAAMQEIYDYSWTERLVPFSLFRQPVASDLSIQFDEAKLAATLQSKSDGIIIAADEQSTARLPSPEVKLLNTTTAANTIAQAFAQNTQEVTIDGSLTIPKVVEVAEVYYTQTSAGLSALVEDWVQEYGSNTYRASVKELGGQKRTAAWKADTPGFSASLYKLYLAYYLYDQLGQGVLRSDDTLGTAYTISGCLEIMVVNSDNACPEALAQAIGWSTLHSFVRSKGYNTTTMEYGGNETSAADTAALLEQLYNGSLISKSSADTLLGYMKRQVHRSAVPAGSSGMAVADKPGFYGSAWHDAAIVYHPQSPYVLVVMSTSGSPNGIAELARRTNTFFNETRP